MSVSLSFHRVFVWLVVAAMLLSGRIALAKELPDFADLAERQGAAVVNISTTQALRQARPGVPSLDEDDPMFDLFRRFIPRGPSAPRMDPDNRSLGSGFIVSPDGYVLTNAHVVDGADEIVVKLTDKREFRARLIGTDPRTDVALLKIDATGLPKVSFGDPGKLRVGDWVVAIGAPFGFENSVTAGIVSAKGRSLPQENFVPFIQTDVAINPGNSGGALVDAHGKLIGINTAIFSRSGGSMGIGFAIPINQAKRVAEEIISTGKSTHPVIGVKVDLQYAGPGAQISEVNPGGAADQAGLKAGDVVLAVGDRQIIDAGRRSHPVQWGEVRLHCLRLIGSHQRSSAGISQQHNGLRQSS